jgi:hypothetical protein
MKTAANLLDLENASEFLARHIGVDADDEPKCSKWWEPAVALH